MSTVIIIVFFHRINEFATRSHDDYPGDDRRDGGVAKHTISEKVDAKGWGWEKEGFNYPRLTRSSLGGKSL